VSSCRFFLGFRQLPPETCRKALAAVIRTRVGQQEAPRARGRCSINGASDTGGAREKGADAGDHRDRVVKRRRQCNGSGDRVLTVALPQGLGPGTQRRFMAAMHLPQGSVPIRVQCIKIAASSTVGQSDRTIKSTSSYSALGAFTTTTACMASGDIAASTSYVTVRRSPASASCAMRTSYVSGNAEPGTTKRLCSPQASTSAARTGRTGNGHLPP
jgi:hypothetical protein